MSSSMREAADMRAGDFQAMRDYVQAEHLEKKNAPYSLDGWKDHQPGDIPMQHVRAAC